MSCYPKGLGRLNGRTEIIFGNDEVAGRREDEEGREIRYCPATVGIPSFVLLKDGISSSQTCCTNSYHQRTVYINVLL